MLKFIVLSDLHIVPEGQHCNGLDTAGRLALAVESINTHHANADFCLIAGDLAELGEVDAYRRMHGILAGLRVPHHVTLGNHDLRDNFLEVYGAACDDPQAGVSTVIDAKGYRVILLDSVKPGTHAGELGPDRLAWLRDRLAEAADRPVVVVLHHNANAMELPCDDIKLIDGADFVAALKSHPDVRQVIAGHVHVTSTGVWHGLPFTTIAGSHYNMSLHLPGVAGDEHRLEGPAQYAVVLGTAEATLVHFHNYIDRHITLAPALFR